MKILMVLTSHDQLGDTGHRTGFWLEELAAPYYVFKDAGAEVTLASPEGGQPPLDPKSDDPDAQTEATRRFKADSAAKAELAIRQCRRPVVAALNGTVAGAGAVIATACDLRIAAPSAKIAFLFTKVGLSGADMGASWLLPRIVGLGHATRLLLTGDFIDAAEAHRIGLYHEVVDDAVAAGRALAERLAAGPSFALEVTKDALNREAAQDLRSAFEHEGEIQAVCMQNPNFREAYQAFVEKRRPRFV